MPSTTKTAKITRIESEVVISFRDVQGKRMHGAFFDHYLVRKITGHSTVTSKSDKQDTAHFEEFITHTTLALGIGKALGDRITPLLSTANPSLVGLLFIPGRMREEVNLDDRDLHEKALIKDALRRGQPILGICGGSWPLYQSLGGSVKSVEDHTYSNMPYIVTSGHVGNNVMVHNIVCQDGTLLRSMMRPLAQPLSVNSVHWLAPDPSKVPNNVRISAISKENESIAPKNRHGRQLKPEESSVEAFETIHGVPVIGISWHPEAFYQKGQTPKNNPHLALLLYMAKAGDAYAAKRRMLEELQTATPLIS